MHLSLPLGGMGLSVIYDCDISLSYSFLHYSLVFVALFTCIFFILNAFSIAFDPQYITLMSHDMTKPT